ncbi:MAG: ABC transporter ATP-binding protein [Acidobacteria bacterium]|nr:ABC transporter ATP-binding protein [Acidobacteriota bacterium]
MSRQQQANFRAIIKDHLWRERRSVAFSMLSMLGLLLTELLSPWPLKIIFDYILLDKPWTPAFAWMAGILANGKTTAVVIVSLGILLISGLRSAFSYYQDYLFSRLGYQLVYTLRRELFAHLQQLSLSYYSRARTGELLNRVTSEAEVFKDVLVESVLNSGAQILTILSMFAILLWLNVRLSLVAFATLPLLFFSLAYIYRKIKISAHKQRQREGKIAARLSEVLSSVTLVKAFGREQYEQDRFDEESTQTLEEGIRTERMAAAATRTVELIRAIGVWGTVLFGALLVLKGQMTPGDLLVFTAYLNDMYKPLRNLAKISMRLSRAAVSMQRLSDILDTEPETWNSESAVVATNLQGEIVFDRVSFDYGDGKEVLKDISFTITPGQHVALVGPSGSGKSTIANLILRFYHAKQGRITIDHVNIENYERETLRREIGVVIQDALLFGASIRENIAYGKPDATIEEIEEAARQAYAHDFIQALPEGYDTIIGERGATLSGGQRQRLCLARAIIKHPSILLLDEPTSAVDIESSALIHTAVDRLREGKTTLVIAHHFADLENYDQILVLRQGQLVEQGTHAELLRRQGEYYRMFWQGRMDEVGASPYGSFYDGPVEEEMR